MLAINSMDWPVFWLAESFIYPHSGKVGYNYFCFLTFRRLCPFYSGKQEKAVKREKTLCLMWL